jgi:phosphotransacetylase
MDVIENRTFAELVTGDTASLVRTLTNKDVELLAVMSGSVNPTHVDEAFAKSDVFHKIVGHGMQPETLISTLPGTQLTGAVLDGPLAFDNAVSKEAARTKGIMSPVAGMADIFVVPDIEAGNILAKQREYLAGAQIAGIVLGARVPIMLTSRAGKTLARLGSSAIALLLARRKKNKAP